jgi:hypothetical protein
MLVAQQPANTASSLLVPGLQAPTGRYSASYPILGSQAIQQTQPHILSHHASLLQPRTLDPLIALSQSMLVSHYAATPTAAEDLTGRKPVILYVHQDVDWLSDYQILARKQIEVFEASSEDVGTSAQGRIRRLRLGQVGIRCRHCAALPLKQRKIGAFYYPSRLDGVYQAAQNLTKDHLADRCLHIPDSIKSELTRAEKKKSPNGAGKGYWSTSIAALGVMEDEKCLRFRPAKEASSHL